MISHVSSIGLIDIQHMQSVIKVFFFFSKIATILVIWKPSDRETRVKILPVFNSYQRGKSQY